MKKVIYFILILALTNTIGLSQNILPNGDFEQFSAIPTSWGQSILCNGWSKLNNGPTMYPYGSPDYFHTSGSNFAQLPNSGTATVSPFSGSAIMGFVTYGEYFVDYREYISHQLSPPMIGGESYTISFWLTNGSANYTYSRSSNHIGVRFSNSMLIQDTSEVIETIPHIDIQNEVWNTTWHFYSFNFVADSSYNFITIGNFYNDSLTTSSVHVNTVPSTNAYYFIDGIQIKPQKVTIQSDSVFCLGSNSIFNFTTNNPVDSVLWSFDDPSSGVANTSTSNNPTHVFTNTGTYTISLFSYFGEYTDTIFKTITVINTIPEINLGNDTTFCLQEELVLDASFPYSNYTWQNNTHNSTYLVTQQGVYWVKVTNSCGMDSDTIVVNYNSLPIVNFGNDTLICQEDSLLLNTDFQNTQFIWQDNSTNSNFNVSQPGTYWVSASNYCGGWIDTINVEYKPLPNFDLGKDTTLCVGDNLLLNASIPNASYIWQDESNQADFFVNQKGVYSVEVTLNGCKASDTIRIDDYCEINLELPNVITVNDDGVNNLFIPIINKGIASMHTSIYNRWGNSVYETDNLLIEWDGKNVTNGTFFWVINYKSKIGTFGSLHGFVTVIY